MLLILILSGLLIVYVYAGYPLLLRSGLLGRKRPVRRGAVAPTVSILIPAHNEETVIGAKIENLLASDYPPDRMEILVGSDGSRDRTAEVVRQHAGRGVRLIEAREQRGKSAIQNDLAAAASGEVLVFTDADCMLSPTALRQMVEPFSDPEIGLTTAIVHYENASATTVTENEGLYWRYERWLRQQESDRGLLSMASGSLFAQRRDLWKPLNAHVGDDFVLPLQVARAGFRNVTVPEAQVACRLTQTQPDSMMRMKIRIISKDLRGLIENREILRPGRFPALAVALWSHKLLRWLIPYFLIALFVASLLLAPSGPWFAAFLAAQSAFYLLALAGWLRGPKRGLPSPWSVPFSFCLVNLAALLGTIHYARGKGSGIWSPVREVKA